MSNPWVIFQRMLSPGPKMIGVVAQVVDGGVVVTLRSGNSVRVSGVGYGVGDSVFIQSGAVIAKAPALADFGSVEV